MPFASKAQQRAAFAGAIPGFSKKRAKQWAAETDFSSLPERAKKASHPRVHGRVLLRALRTVRDAADSVAQPGTLRDALGAHAEYQEHKNRKKAAAFEELVKLCALMNVRPPTPKLPALAASTTRRTSMTMQNAKSARQVGNFGGRAPGKLPGPVAGSQAVNPHKALRTAITPTTTKAVGSPRAMPGF